MDTTSYTQLPIAAVLGLLAPLLVSALKQVSWSTQTKLVVTVGVSALFAALAAVASGQFSTENYVGSLGVVFTVATLFYKTYFVSTDMNTWLEQIGAPTVPVESAMTVISADSQAEKQPIDTEPGA